MNHRAFTLVDFALGVTVTGVVVAVLFPIFGRARNSCGPRNSCPSNLKQIALGLVQYGQDYDGRFPLAAFQVRPEVLAPLGWAEAMYPYVQTTVIFQCPQEPNRPAEEAPQFGWIRQPQHTDYWFNARLGAVNAGNLRFPASVLLLGDGNDGTKKCDITYSLSTLPLTWRALDDSPAQRHQGGANYAFADGHAKWLKPPSVTLGLANAANFSFLPGSKVPIPNDSLKEVP